MNRVAEVLRRATGHHWGSVSRQPRMLTGPVSNTDVAVLSPELLPHRLHEEIRRAADPPRLPARAAAATAPRKFESGAGWLDALQIAARLKLVVGADRCIVAVTGVEPTDGGTLLAAKVAAAMAQIDHARVLVVEANVAAPALGGVFGLPPAPGFLDLLERRVELIDVIQPMTPGNLYVLPLGSAVGSLASLLTSAAGTSVMRTIREQFRYVIVDAGLIRRDPGAMLLASLADGVVVAVGVAARRREEIVNFQQELQRLNIPLFGLVLTRA
jgi:Mrp family chromosome partitioning ATPase